MKATVLFCVLALWFISVPGTFGIASTTQVAWPGKAVEFQAGWPQGALELINDPARRTGWNPWFSELPNDVIYFGFETPDGSDLQRLINKAAALGGAIIVLSRKSIAPWVGFGGSSRWSSNTAAVLALGDQTTLNAWHARQAPARTSTSGNALNLRPNAPRALPPTLTLYVAHPTVALDRISIPASVRVVAEEGATEMSKDEQRASKQIDSFLRQRY